MVLKVFTPSQARTATEERLAKDALRAKGLSEITRDLLNTRNEAERDFEKSMKRQQEIAEKWFEDNLSRKNKLTKEVVRLEERRRQALMPPLIKEEDIHSTSERLHARKLVLDLQESEQEDQSRLLMRKLDELSTKEQDLASREQRVRRMERGAEEQKNQVSKDARHLNMQMEEFQKKVEEKETDFAFRQSELDAEENLYNERDNLLRSREDEIEAAKRLLVDQRVLLDKGFEELRKEQSKLKAKHK